MNQTIHQVRLEGDIIVALGASNLLSPDATEVSAADAAVIAALGVGRARLVDGEVVAFDPPLPPPTIDDYRRAIQNHVDATAQQRAYDSGVTCSSYVNSTNPVWAAEAAAFVAWRDAVWAYAYAELEKVEAGTRPQPSVAEILAELPAMGWPV